MVYGKMITINGGDNMYNIAICEDELVQEQQLIRVLKRYELEHKIKLNVTVFESAELLMCTTLMQFDLFFLDIGLPGINGVELAQKIRHVSTHSKIAFLTAHEQFWPEGYKILASRFLVKPLSDDLLYAEVFSLLNEFKTSQLYILATKDKAIAKVLIEEILYLEIYGRKVLIHTFDGTYTSSYSLSYWVKKLASHHFVQTHSSYLVNLKHVKIVGRDTVTLITEDKVYISLRKYKQFKESFMRYVSQI
ncbi:MAG: LytTR family DNA-binding domain-containing protein [Turicibacter sp.]|nr:LytTR family DNA-binding domain-containing protein [Turicibacter sp.]MDO4926479.1 LytTR family DNA-binding domain-containing protein [Turicibacter sp.]